MVNRRGSSADQQGAARPTVAAARHDAPLVVQVVRQYRPGRGGLEDVVANLSKAVQAEGFRVRIVTCDRLFSDPTTPLPAREFLDGIEVVRVPFRGSRRYPLAFSVFKHLGDADLVHVHAVDFFFDALAIGRVMHRKPMVATTHGGFFHTPRFARIKRIWFQTVTRLSARAYDALACCSRSDLALFQRIQPHRAVLIENGVDTTKLVGCSSTVAVRRLLTIGRFSSNKRLDWLLATMATLSARDADWHLTIAGSPSDLSRDDLVRMIDHHGLTGRVALMVSPDDGSLAEAARAASLFVSASDYEGFGLVAVEAMSAGLVPVLNGNAAYRALQERHPDLTVTDFSNPATAAAAIEAAFQRCSADGESLRQRLMAMAQAYAWDHVARHYVALYTEMLAAPIAGPVAPEAVP